MSGQNYQFVTIKVGTSVITGKEGLPENSIIQNICSQIATLKARGVNVALISSGAVAAGRRVLPDSGIKDTIERRQVLAALGQIELMTLYSSEFAKHDILCSQVLVTKEDFKTREHYVNMRKCLTALIKAGVVPVINENDVVAITELMFTDNDELAGLVSAMLNSDAMIMLTGVDGIYSKDPTDPSSEVIKVFDSRIMDQRHLSAGKSSQFGRGGVLTKCQTALKTAAMGIPVHIVNGQIKDVVLQVIDNTDPPGTYFPSQKSASGTKRLIAHTYDPKGKAVINEGAKEALTSQQANSLLLVGIKEIVGNFEKGDVIRIEDESGHEIGLGRVKLNSDQARKVVGLQGLKAFVHYDHLFIHSTKS